MWRLKASLRPAMALLFASHFALFFTASWLILSLLLRFDALTVSAAAFLLTVASIAAEWLMGPNLVTSLLKPRWITKKDDPILWSLVQGEASKAGVKIGRMGIIDEDSPNALIIASPTGQTILLFTRSLLYSLNHEEVRAATAYLMGASKSGYLGASTTFSGLLAISYRFSAGYIESTAKGLKGSIYDIALAILGYPIFALAAPLSVMASRPMSSYGDDFSITQTGDPASFLTMLLKVAGGISRNPKGPNRAHFTPVKGLMLFDPTIALRDYDGLMKAAQSYGIDTGRLLGVPATTDGKNGEIEFHAFERFWSQPNLIDRFRHAVSSGKGVKTPIKIGLTWIE